MPIAAILLSLFLYMGKIDLKLWYQKVCYKKMIYAISNGDVTDDIALYTLISKILDHQMTKEDSNLIADVRSDLLPL